MLKTLVRCLRRQESQEAQAQTPSLIDIDTWYIERVNSAFARANRQLWSESQLRAEIAAINTEYYVRINDYWSWSAA